MSVPRHSAASWLPAGLLGLFGLLGGGALQLAPQPGQPVLVLMAAGQVADGTGAALAAGWRVVRSGQQGRFGFVIAAPDNNSDAARLWQATQGWVVLSARGSAGCAPGLRQES